MARFRLVLVQPPGYVHALALDDIRAYLGAHLRALGHDVDAPAPAPPLAALADGGPPARAVVLGAHLLEDAAAARLPATAIVFNSEALIPGVTATSLPASYRAVLARHRVWDYTAANLAELPHARVDVIPFGPRPGPAPARAPGTGRDDAGPVLFYGSLTPRRHRVLRELAALGVELDVRFGAYGEARDALIRGARVVLNLHQREHAGVFQPVRCASALWLGTPVISEDTTDPSAAPLRAALTALPSAGLARGIAAALADRPGFAARAAAQRAAFARVDPRPALAAAVAHALAEPA